MRTSLFFYGFLFLASSPGLWALDQRHEMSELAKKVDDPNSYLKEVGPLVLMGNAPIESAELRTKGLSCFKI